MRELNCQDLQAPSNQTKGISTYLELPHSLRLIVCYCFELCTRNVCPFWLVHGCWKAKLIAPSHSRTPLRSCKDGLLDPTFFCTILRVGRLLRKAAPPFLTQKQVSIYSSLLHILLESSFNGTFDDILSRHLQPDREHLPQPWSHSKSGFPSPYMIRFPKRTYPLHYN